MQTYGECLIKIYIGGQCFNELTEKFPELQNNELFCEVKDLWEKHHLNDMHAGTSKQEATIKKWESRGNAYDYVKVCEYLQSIGLYEDVLENGTPYRYGSGWLKEEIPEKDILRIKSLIEKGKIYKEHENELDLEEEREM